MAYQVDLRDGETILQEVKGDYWEKQFLTFYSQKTGKYWFTSDRILFKGSLIASLDLEYKQIESIKTCGVGPLFPMIPTGIKVSMKDGGEYKLSVLGRKKIMDLIESRMK